MVCRRWYEEAGRIFYSRNTFAFEDGATFTCFISNLDNRWRSMITRVSIMAFHPEDVSSSSSEEERESGWESTSKLRPVWSLLRQLPALSYLELDTHFLNRASTVKAMLRLGLRNVRRVCFTLHNRWNVTTCGSEWIWPEYHNARLLVGGFAEEVARAIKGQRRPWLKKAGAVARAAQRIEELEDRIINLKTKSDEVGCGNVYYCTDLEEWNRLWGEVGYHHVYLPSGDVQVRACRSRWRDMHWREWNRTTVGHQELLGYGRTGSGYGEEVEDDDFLFDLATFFQMKSDGGPRDI